MPNARAADSSVLRPYFSTLETLSPAVEVIYSENKALKPRAKTATFRLPLTQCVVAVLIGMSIERNHSSFEFQGDTWYIVWQWLERIRERSEMASKETAIKLEINKLENFKGSIGGKRVSIVI